MTIQMPTPRSIKPFANNRELYEYMVALSSQLASHGLQELSKDVIAARRHAAGMSTEFLGESRLVLRRVLMQGAYALAEQQRADLQDVLNQLDSALDRR